MTRRIKVLAEAIGCAFMTKLYLVDFSLFNIPFRVGLVRSIDAVRELKLAELREPSRGRYLIKQMRQELLEQGRH